MILPCSMLVHNYVMVEGTFLFFSHEEAGGGGGWGGATIH